MVAVGVDAVWVIAPAAVAPLRTRPAVATSAVAVRTTARRAVCLVPISESVRIEGAPFEAVQVFRTNAMERDVTARSVTRRLRLDNLGGTNAARFVTRYSPRVGVYRKCLLPLRVEPLT